MKRIMWVIVASLVLAFSFQPALSETIAIAQSHGVTLSLTDEPCALDGVSNLKLRAVWQEAKGSFEGCWGSQLEGNLVVLYFSDKSVMGVPGPVFKTPNSL